MNFPSRNFNACVDTKVGCRLPLGDGQGPSKLLSHYRDYTLGQSVQRGAAWFSTREEEVEEEEGNGS